VHLEVPVMLSLVKIMERNREKFEFDKSKRIKSKKQKRRGRKEEVEK